MAFLNPRPGRIFYGLLLGLSLLVVAKAAAACPLPAGNLHYKVFNDGQPVGNVWIDVARQGERTTVSTLIKVKVALLFVIPVLNYRHESEEIWTGDGFRQFTGRTVDNGRAYDVRITPNGAGLQVKTNGAVSEVATPLLSHAVWCEASIAGPRIFSPLKGRMKDFASEYLGETVIAVDGRRQPARAYAITQMRKGTALVRRGRDRREGELSFEAEHAGDVRPSMKMKKVVRQRQCRSVLGGDSRV
ncbi:MAG: hypothetical protein J4G10_06145 [Alphaproteobacteria bacterium]|nr:hypothetical protein [Alphaproteobacteria bacterium]